MKAKIPQSQEMDNFFKSRFHASRVHGTPQKHEWHYLCCRNYTIKQFPTLFTAMVPPLLSIGPIVIHLLVQLCTVIHVYFDHLSGLQTSENALGKFDTRTKVVCTFMCKNNAWIQSMCQVR